MEQGHPFSAPEMASTLDALGLEFLAGILEVEIGRNPQNLAAWIELGHVYTRARRYEKGLEVDRELVRRCPDDPTTHYNLACSLALLAKTAEAFDELERAVALGYEDVEHLRADEDLASLRGSARFQAIVQALSAPEGSQKPPSEDPER
jgi:tetratricopeptide (TPR) repeat protein